MPNVSQAFAEVTVRPPEAAERMVDNLLHNGQLPQFEADSLVEKLSGRSVRYLVVGGDE
jgi:hypothetical protein